MGVLRVKIFKARAAQVVRVPCHIDIAAAVRGSFTDCTQALPERGASLAHHARLGTTKTPMAHLLAQHAALAHTATGWAPLHAFRVPQVHTHWPSVATPLLAVRVDRAALAVALYAPPVVLVSTTTTPRQHPVQHARHSPHLCEAVPRLRAVNAVQDTQGQEEGLST